MGFEGDEIFLLDEIWGIGFEKSLEFGWSDGFVMKSVKKFLGGEGRFGEGKPEKGFGDGILEGIGHLGVDKFGNLREDEGKKIETNFNLTHRRESVKKMGISQECMLSIVLSTLEVITPQQVIMTFPNAEIVEGKMGEKGGVYYFLERYLPFFSHSDLVPNMSGYFQADSKWQFFFSTGFTLESLALSAEIMGITDYEIKEKGGLLQMTEEARVAPLSMLMDRPSWRVDSIDLRRDVAGTGFSAQAFIATF